MDEVNFTSTLQEAFKLAVNMLQQPGDAQDVVQDAVAVALTHQSAPSREDEQFRPWFFKVVRNKAIDRLRAQKREIKRVETKCCEQHTNEAKSPEQHLMSEQLNNQLNTALSKLTIDHREIILLKDLHGFSYEEIASILGIAKGSVMSRLHRARMALRTLFMP